MPYRYIEKVLNASAAPLHATEMEFLATGAARVCTAQALAMEDKYSLILQNYFEFEQALHRLALENLLYRANKWTDHVDNIRDVNRVLMNLLTAKKMYVDQIPQHINRIYAPSDAESRLFTEATRKEFDGFLGYRVMYTLRNHAQHGDFPVQSLSLGSTWQEDGQARHCAHTAIAFAHRDDVVQNTDLNAKVRAEVSEMPEKIDLVPLVRESMSCFARLHRTMRETIGERLANAESTLKHAHAHFEAHAGRRPVALYIVHVGDDGSELESHSIFLDALERRARLELQSATLTNMEQHYVSGLKK